MTRLANREFETFTLIYLDNRHRLIACQDLFRGTIDGASVHPREVVKEGLRRDGAGEGIGSRCSGSRRDFATPVP
jgi:DNA repair protein RadC